jgi:hypothetical protein
MAACKVESMSAVEEAVAKFVKGALALEREKQEQLWNSVVLAHWRAQSYKWELYTDLWDFFNELGKQLGDRHDIYKYCNDVTTAVDNAGLCSRFSGSQFQHSHGLSVYFPWSRLYYAPEYEQTQFAKRTDWNRFLETYFRETRRPKRKELPEVPQGWEVVPLGQVAANNENGADESLLPINVRTNAPHGRTNAPHGRLSDLISALDDSQCRMKNPAGAAKNYVVLPKGEEAKAFHGAIEREKDKMAKAIEDCQPSTDRVPSQPAHKWRSTGRAFAWTIGLLSVVKAVLRSRV